ncbi:lactate 2-monooxygenase [Deinococcus sp. HSC-46F16]|uniref:alpha-hydroxy-acid oxidizing protein n=1 Tax=Deinococcus sp. HSC-46F16 TaxID=2910968 RepID=UPI00209F0116|nr:alpha-hydroxy-acid oxidizing protein [Deinococcus sp. HSC-46F16]MCP2015828.1 lactate 2-monooxygenase [Deinococcus sp. HSC-46F16]
MTTNPPAGPGRARQTRLYVRGLGGERPAVPVFPERLQAAAKAKMSAADFAYVAGGAGAERTMRANLAAFERVRLMPRRLSGTRERDLGVELLGLSLPSPLLLAPIGVLEAAHPQADLAVARAAAAERVPFIFSSQASVPMETCAEAMGDSPRLFQLYWGTDDEVTRSFVRRAEACGAAAIVLTLDTTLLGWRPRDLDLGSLPFLRGRGLAQYLSDPVFRSRLGTPLPAPDVQPPRTPALIRTGADLAAKGRAFGLSAGQMRSAAARFTATYTRPDLSWDDVGRLREWTRLPILLKGILHPDDAREAVRRGVDGLIVSNHGGRQIDGEVAALDALPGVVAAAGGLPVLLDSGVRTGSDVAKALALGARAVLLGRPYVYGLALAGEAGVREVIGNVLAEFDLTLGLLGLGAARDLGPGALAPSHGPDLSPYSGGRAD